MLELPDLLRYDETIAAYTGRVDIAGTPVELQLYTDADDVLEPALRRAREVLAEFAKYDRRAQAYAARELLPLKNDLWLEEDEAPVTAAQFQQRMTLEALIFYAEGDVTFYYQDGDLFWGHTIEVGLDAAGDFNRAHIAG